MGVGTAPSTTGDGAPPGESVSLDRYIGVLRRRKWLVLVPTILLPILAIALSAVQTPQYEASAEVLLSRQNLAAMLTGVQDPNATQQADRLAATNAELARVPSVVRGALRSARPRPTVDEFLAASRVYPKTNSDLLVFAVKDRHAEDAASLATAYATAYAAYRARLDTAAIKQARREVEQRLADLERRRERRSALYASLTDKDQQLRTLEALQTSNASVVQTATGAVQVRPRLFRDAVLGFILGLGLGVALAFLREALDTRIRTSQEIEQELGVPLLGRLGPPPRTLEKSSGLVMLRDPGDANAEGYRMLRSNLDFVSLDKDVRAVLVTSALEQEGKTTTVANLSVALALSGVRVVVVDLDLRRPSLGRFFELDNGPGLTDVVRGRASLDEALAAVPLGESSGVLEVLPSGSLPPDPGEFVGTRRLAGVIEALKARAEIVLIDSPPILAVGDALTLSRNVDGVIVITRLGVVHRPTLSELARTLRTTAVRPLGFVVTGADHDLGYGYGYGYGQGRSDREETVVQKARTRSEVKDDALTSTIE